MPVERYIGLDPHGTSCTFVSAICAVDSYCCDSAWDATCVAEVRTVCGSLTCSESQGDCSHPLCTSGAALVANCDDPPVSPGCVDQICAADPFCCSTDWDSICVRRVQSDCGLNCNSWDGRQRLRSSRCRS